MLPEYICIYIKRSLVTKASITRSCHELGKAASKKIYTIKEVSKSDNGRGREDKGKRYIGAKKNRG